MSGLSLFVEWQVGALRPEISCDQRWLEKEKEQRIPRKKPQYLPPQ
jgi:hypothetical protein